MMDYELNPDEKASACLRHTIASFAAKQCLQGTHALTSRGHKPECILSSYSLVRTLYFLIKTGKTVAPWVRIKAAFKLSNISFDSVNTSTNHRPYIP